MAMVSPQRVLPPPVPHPTLTKSVHSSNLIVQPNNLIEHPNGSDGWLPAENPPRQEERRRRSVFRTSRHATTEPRSALVNGTPPAAAAAAIPDEELQNRAVLLTPKQRSRIEKSEAKDGRRISKIIKQEGRTEKQTLDIAINELEELQRFQQNALKTEARAHVTHSKSLFAFKKTEAAHLNAKMRYEAALSEIHAEAEALETLKNNSKEAAEHVQEKSAQVDSLRTTLALEERRRELKLSDLKASPVNGAMKRSSSLWRR